MMAMFPNDPTHGEVKEELRKVRSRVFLKASHSYLEDYLVPEILNTPTGEYRNMLTDLQIMVMRILDENLGWDAVVEGNELEAGRIAASKRELEAGDGDN